MRTADAETLYIFFKNDSDSYYEKRLCDGKLIHLYKLWNEAKQIKKKASFFAELYLPYMQKYIFKFLKEQKEMECPNKMPSKTAMLETARIFAEECILDYYGEKANGAK